MKDHNKVLILKIILTFQRLDKNENVCVFFSLLKIGHSQINYFFRFKLFSKQRYEFNRFLFDIMFWVHKKCFFEFEFNFKFGKTTKFFEC